jgi:pyrroloquinoline-quinone synthase
MVKCAACSVVFMAGDYQTLAKHFVKLAGQNDVPHVMWLNRYITNQKQDESSLEKLLREYFDLSGTTLQNWIRKRFVEKFYGETPHPFVVALQHPSRATLLGYVVEHQHFLKQWVRSCSYIVAKTDKTDVTMYELDNINTEFGGFGGNPSHYELLLRMGESLGLERNKILETSPLPDTALAIKSWDQIARESHWVETMAAMHSLELIADRTLVQDGAKMTYFDPAILKTTTEEVTVGTKNFLREGYEADAVHSKEALDLVEKYSKDLGLIEDVQAVFLKSMDLFHMYLMARLERGEQFSA